MIRPLHARQSRVSRKIQESLEGKADSSISAVTPTEIVTLTRNSSSLSVPTTTASPTCVDIPYGVEDTPSTKEPGTDLLFREKCGITHDTVAECPYLCGPNGEGTIKGCFPFDISDLAGEEGVQICTQCLLPCEKDKATHTHPAANCKCPPTCAKVFSTHNFLVTSQSSHFTSVKTLSPRKSIQIFVQSQRQVY